MFRFSVHTFDTDTGELGGPRESLRLQPKPARLLAMLLEAGGELVEREQIRATLWPDTTVDFDAGLNTCMRQIRTGLRESGGEAPSLSFCHHSDPDRKMTSRPRSSFRSAFIQNGRVLMRGQ